MAEDLFDQVKNEMNENENIADEDISWDDVEEDLAKQREMIKEDAKKKAPPPDQKVPNLDFILDIPLKLSVELGRTKLLINDLLQLGQGSVIELNKLAGEPLEVLVNDKLIARGEAVVVNEKFGVRITDILSPMDRVEKLSE